MRIDLHAHVLPGIDDGPKDTEGSLAMLRAVESDGTGVIAASPHLRADFPGVRVEEIAARCAELNATLLPGHEVRAVPSGEVDLLWAQRATSEQLALASYCQRGSDILLETPYGRLPGGFEEVVSGIARRGFRILLAHPERNPTFQGDPRRLSALVRRGVLLQVTAAALASTDRRSRSRRLAHALVEQGLAHVIASDAHSAGVSGRSPLSAGVEAAARLAPRRAPWMAEDVPAAILAGEPLPPAPSEQPAGRRLLRRRSSRAVRAEGDGPGERGPGDA